MSKRPETSEQQQQQQQHQASKKSKVDAEVKEEDAPPLIIAVWAEKGGVGKTSIASSLAFAFGVELGIPTLLIDCDSQRSLTSFLLGGRLAEGNGKQTLTEFVQSNNTSSSGLPSTLHEQLLETWSCGPVRPAQTVALGDTLHLVPGDRHLSSFDRHICNYEALSAPGIIAYNLTGAAHLCVLATAKSIKARVVILDLNPSGGDVNRCLHRDDGGASVKDMTKAYPVSAASRYPALPPDQWLKKFGYVLNRSTPTESCLYWAARIKAAFSKLIGNQENPLDKPLAFEIADYGSELAARSCANHKPVGWLPEEKNQAAVAENDETRKEFVSMANQILSRNH